MEPYDEPPPAPALGFLIFAAGIAVMVAAAGVLFWVMLS